MGWSAYLSLLLFFPFLVHAVDSVIGWGSVWHILNVSLSLSCDVTLSTGATPVTSASPQSIKEGTPVIASVVSLSNASNKQPGVLRNTDPKGDLTTGTLTI